jgi:glycosyltransferase involved in cell wall biosynthesis
MSVVVAQLGARMHYAVPRLLNRAGLLERLYTDICANKGWPQLLQAVPRALRPASLQRLLGRAPAGIPSHRVTAFTSFGLEYARRYARAGTPDERNATFLWSGREFCRRVVDCGFGEARAVYGFNSASLEILQAARARGLKGVVEQTIAPRAMEWTILKQEALCFPEWEAPAPKDSMMEDYCARESAEWAAADLVVCGSDFVRDGVVAQQGDSNKCVVVPYGLEMLAEREAAPNSFRAPGPLRVLTVGAVGLRKGSPYVLAAARQLGKHAEFRMVGPIEVLPEAQQRLRRTLDLAGSVPRSAMAAHYSWADVFLLPSLCEGSATATYEALFHGLPVICTRETGGVIRNGLEGFVVPSRNSDVIVDKLASLIEQPQLLATMSRAAQDRASEYDLDCYGSRLLTPLRERGLV